MRFGIGGGALPALDDGLWAAVFGGAAADGSLTLAQHAETALPDGTQDQVDRLEGG